MENRGGILSIDGSNQLIDNLSLSLKDLHNRVTPSYAAHWRVIGTQLGLPKGTLDIIEHDNYHKAEACCDAMLEKWLDVDPTASSKELETAIESLTQSDQAPDKGSSVYYSM